MKTNRSTGRQAKPRRGVGEAAMRRAAKDARETARRHGTRVIVMRDGKIVAEKP